MASKALIISSSVAPIGFGKTGGVEVTLESIVTCLTQFQTCDVTLLCPENSIYPEQGIKLITAGGDLEKPLQHEAHNSTFKANPTGVANSMLNKALKIQQNFDLIINLSYDYELINATSVFKVPYYNLISMCSHTQYMHDLIRSTTIKYPNQTAFHTHAQANTFNIKNHSHIIYNGLNKKKYTFYEKPSSSLLWSGRLSPEKGIEDALEVSKENNLSLKVMGHTDDQDYHTMLKSRYDKNLVQWAGYLPHSEFQKQIGDSSVMIFTPKWSEAMGNCLIEANMAGVPVISYQSGGISEIVENGVTGFITENNSPESISSYLALAQKLCRKIIRKKAEEKFSLEAFNLRLESWLETRNSK